MTAPWMPWHSADPMREDDEDVMICPRCKGDGCYPRDSECKLCHGTGGVEMSEAEGDDE